MRHTWPADGAPVAVQRHSLLTSALKTGTLSGSCPDRLNLGNELPVKGKKGKAVPLHAMEALGGRGGIAPTQSRPLH